MSKFKEDFIKLQNRLSRLSLRTPRIPWAMQGAIVSCDTQEEVYQAGIFCVCMGVPARLSDDYITQSLLEGKQYVGVIKGNFGIYNSNEVISAEKGYSLYSLKDMDYRETIRNYSSPSNAIVCETPESAIYLSILADDAGYRWSSGTRYVETDMYYENDDVSISYNLHEGVHGEGERKWLSNYRLQYLLFNINKSMVLLPEGLDFNSLRTNSINVVLREMPNSYASQLHRIVFKKVDNDINGSLIYMDGEGFIREIGNLLGATGLVILEATDEEKRKWGVAYREYKIKRAEERAYARGLRMKERESRLTRARERQLQQMYPMTEDQLFSYRMHQFLFKVCQTNKIAKTLLKLNNLGYTKGSLRNITISKSTQEMTYTLPNKDTVMTANNRWEKKGRQSGKYGKILRKVLVEQVPKFKINDSELEQLVNHLKACADNGEFQIVSGEDIQYWYDGDRYADDEDTGTLGSSCMRHNPSYVELYARNPDVCQMVVLVKDEHLYGRALLWEGKWMDRIYGSDSTVTAFKAHAKNKGFHSKSAQNSNNCDRWINPETGEEYHQTITISLDTDCEYYPYADTFFFLDREGGMISNSEIGDGTQLRSTDGDLYDDDRVYDEYDDRYIHADDAVYMDYIGYSTHVDNTRYCEITCEYYLEEDMITLSNGDMAYKKAPDVVYCEEDYVYAHIDDTFTCEHDEITYCSESNTSEYIDELGITVHECNVEDAYIDAGYVYNDETMEWEELKTKQEA